MPNYTTALTNGNQNVAYTNEPAIQRKGNVNRGKRKGVKYIIKVL